MAGENRGPEMLIVIWIFTSLSIITVALKLITRVHILHALGWDDFFIFFSVILIIACTAIFTYDVHLGMGQHASDLPPDQLSYIVKVNFIGNPFGIMAYSFPNISVAILLNRLLVPNTTRAFALYLLAGSQCVIAGISCILLFTQCTPTEFLWNPTISATCFPSGLVSRYSYFVGAYTAFTDIVLGLVPIAAFWKLKLATKTKIGLCFLMGCTLFAAICSIIKATKLDELSDLGDFTYATVDLVIWAIVEANVIIIAACLPTLRPFFHNTFKKQKVSEGRSFFRSKSMPFSFGFGSKKSLVSSLRNQRIDNATDLQSRSQRDVEDGAQRGSRPSAESQIGIWRTTEIDMTVLAEQDQSAHPAVWR